jgi:hypothetical protein
LPNDCRIYPTIKVFGPGNPLLVGNVGSGGDIYLRAQDVLDSTGSGYETYACIDGDTWTIEYNSSGIRASSTAGVNVLSRIINPSNTNTSLVTPRENVVAAFMYPSWNIYNDAANQILYLRLNGYSFSNTDSWTLYISIVADGVGFYHANFYKDAARASLVAHTASLNAATHTPVIADGGSGITGYVFFSPTAADVDILIHLGHMLMRWQTIYDSLDYR